MNLTYLISLWLACASFCTQAADYSVPSSSEYPTHSASKGNIKKNITKHALEMGNMVYEKDGSITLLKDNLLDALSAINSSVGSAVNFNLVYAKNSSVLTADGKQTLELIASALSYLDADTRIDIEMPQHSSRGKNFTEQRGAEIVRLLRSAYGLKHEIHFYTAPQSNGSISKPNAGQPSSTSAEVERITVLNMGKSS